MSRVYVSIGSNIDRENNIRGAVQALRKHYTFLTLSRVYETPAEGFEGEAFYNLVAGFDTDEPVERVRQTLADIETAHGRKRGGARFSARTLDIDLLLYGDLVRHAGGIDIPRGEITKYAFVLGPLAELDPALRDPESGACYADLWALLDSARKRLTPVMPDLDT